MYEIQMPSIFKIIVVIPKFLHWIQESVYLLTHKICFILCCKIFSTVIEFKILYMLFFLENTVLVVKEVYMSQPHVIFISTNLTSYCMWLITGSGGKYSFLYHRQAIYFCVTENWVLRELCYLNECKKELQECGLLFVCLSKSVMVSPRSSCVCGPREFSEILNLCSPSE